MPYDTIFTASQLLAVPFWFLMIVLPNWSWTKRIISSPYIVLPAALFFPNIETILNVLADPPLPNFSGCFLEGEYRPKTNFHLYRPSSKTDTIA